VVEQHLKNAAEKGFVLVCFFGLGFVASAGCVPKSAGKCWQVKKSAEKC
jgi:hypothetical protein